MDVADAMVRKCKKESIIVDKKMREHRIEHEKYIIIPCDKIVFDNLDQFKIIRKRTLKH